MREKVHRFPAIDLLLGAASIPITLIVTPEPSSIDISPVLVAGFVSGLYYERRSESVRHAGFRTGLVGGVPIVWSSIDFVVSELSAPSYLPALAILVGAIWFTFALLVTAFVTAICARAGGWTSSTVSGAVRQ
ncbi:DUF5518 domain-containing protein [Halovivax cerinus]|uniref:DUF5518 domain-containing protein n=1 Tax=Halovivax cerinus TaxID=1487865 RepID=A0ABD5NMB5_9EURY|nr:DUF5518 domain-containing protein [Halovivax cerinus]